MNTSSSSNGQQRAGSSSPSPAVLECITHLRGLQSAHAEWFDEYEDAMVDLVADRATIERLLATAPTDFLRGMLYGKLAMRMQISNLTERSF